MVINTVSMASGLFYRAESIPHPPQPPTPDSDFQFSKQDYYEVTRRVLNKEKRLAIDQKFAVLGKEGVDFPFVHVLLESPDWWQKIVEWDLAQPVPHHFDYAALQSLRNGNISQNQFGTLMYVRQAQRTYGKLEMIPLFINGKPNPRAKELILKTMAIPVNSKLATVYGVTKPYLSEEQVDAMLQCMSTLPVCEQQFFIAKEDEYGREESLAKHLEENPSLCILWRYHEGLTVHRMIPSIGLMQSYLNVKHAENAAKINVVMGESSIHDLERNILGHTRDLSVAFPGFALPTLVGSLKTNGIDYTLYCFYNCMICSGVNKVYRLAFMFLGNYVKSVLTHATNTSFYIGAMRLWWQQCIQMEHFQFRPEIKAQIRVLRSNSLFWLSFKDTISMTVHQYINQNVRTRTFKYEVLKEAVNLNFILEHAKLELFKSLKSAHILLEQEFDTDALPKNTP